MVLNPFSLILMFGTIFGLKQLLVLFFIDLFVILVLLISIYYRKIKLIYRASLLLSILGFMIVTNMIVQSKIKGYVPNTEAIKDKKVLIESRKFLLNKDNQQYRFENLYFINPVSYNFKNIYSVVEDNLTGVNVRNSVNHYDSNYIWFFGGSTMYSALTDDNHTIPSLFSKYAYDDNKKIAVRNYGIVGFNSSTELLNYFELLRRATVKPKIVIFYDGYNDSTTSLNYGPIYIKSQPGYNLFGNQTLKQMGYYTVKFLNEKSILFEDLIGKNIIYAYYLKYKADFSDENIEKIAKRYTHNIQLIAEISKLYNIKVFFFLQPMPFTKKPLSLEEESRKNPNYVYSNKVYNIIRKDNIENNNFTDISHIFNDNNNTLFVDEGGHAHNEGNIIVAKEIYKALKQGL